MIEWISNLPKIIDAFITGVIEFFYRFLGAVLIVSRNPLNGARKLEQGEEQLSSRTMLFGSVSLFVLGTFIRVSNAGALSGVGLLNFLVIVILTYVGVDAAAAMGARFATARQTSDAADKVRDYLRYAFAASLILVGIGGMIFQGLIDSMQGQFENARTIEELYAFRRKFYLCVVVIGLMLLSFFQPAGVLVSLLQWGAGQFSRVLRTILLSLTTALAFAAFMVAVYAVFFRFNAVVDGKVFATPATCTATPEGVRVAIMVENASARPTYLTRYTLKLRLGYGLRPGEEPQAALIRSHEDVPIVRIEGDAFLVDARANARVTAEARPTSAQWRQFLAAGEPGVCQLIKGQTSRGFELDETGQLDFAVAPLPGPSPTASRAP